MDYAPQIMTALQEKLDIGQAFPIVYTMSVATAELFSGNVFMKLQERICKAMESDAEPYIEKNDALGLSLHLMKGGIKLPPAMLYEICGDIVAHSRKYARWIAPAISSIPSQNGGIWHARMYVDMAQEGIAGAAA